jgi:tRNA threonylcarbamoyladenosine dehydratase
VSSGFVSREDRPTILPFEGARAKLDALRAAGMVDEVVDGFEPSLAELFSIEHPNRGDASARERFIAARRAELLPGSVVAILPWRRCAVHLPDPETYLRLRTSRNRLLVTDDEQLRFREAAVAVGGLSVGFSIVHDLVLGGGPRRLRIGDFDCLSIPNLNRLPHSVCEVGVRKTRLAARRVYELDPFAEVTEFDEGVARENLHELLAPNGRPVDVFFEEMDQLHMKFAARKVARELRVPVVMVTDLGDGVTIDVERFDLEPDRPLLHGAIDEATALSIGPELTMRERVRIASAVVRPEEMPPRLQESMLAIGTQIHAWPQLGTAVSVAGAAGAYVARRLITGAEMPSGRYSLSLDAAIDPRWHSAEATQHRKVMTRSYEQRTGLATADSGS